MPSVAFGLIGQAHGFQANSNSIPTHMKLHSLCRPLGWLVLGIAVAFPASARSEATTTRPGALLIGFRDERSATQARASLPGDILIDAQTAPGSFALRVPVGAEMRSLARLAALPGVAYAQLD